MNWALLIAALVLVGVVMAVLGTLFGWEAFRDTKWIERARRETEEREEEGDD